ncbi:uncharacterized protein LOC142591083 isoform X2 [Dermacentor variabilis]|uniref:uncharacterized protein LOC142591083 isoform X2 n=1 Tax=Dermacentor variabilis TaxID=34621 RepID=UPI003F5B1709
MYIQLLAPFAVYAFVFASHCLTAALDSAPQLLGTESHGEVVVGSPQFPIFPANNSQDLYLVGYSSALEHQDIRCVSSTFHKRRGEEVDRYLLMYIHDEKKSWDFTGFKTTIYIPDSPIIFSINVAYEPEALAKQYNALSRYHIIYYDDDTMILANNVPGVQEPWECSPVPPPTDLGGACRTSCLLQASSERDLFCGEGNRSINPRMLTEGINAAGFETLPM